MLVLAFPQYELIFSLSKKARATLSSLLYPDIATSHLSRPVIEAHISEMMMSKPRYDQTDSSSDDAGKFAKTLPEDCVEYSIAVIESMLDNVAIRQLLRAVQSSATSLTKRLLKGYIWQRDIFRLDIAQEYGKCMVVVA